MQVHSVNKIVPPPNISSSHEEYTPEQNITESDEDREEIRPKRSKRSRSSTTRKKTKAKKKFNAINKRDNKGRFLPLANNDETAAAKIDRPREENPLICCACEQLRTKAQFSSKYQIHAKNIEKYEKFLGKTLKFGQMCNKCYMSWSHYKKVGHKAYHSRRILRKHKRRKGLDCVICKKHAPDVSFSNSYYVHENNIERYRKIYPQITFGELCNKCYQFWYKRSKGLEGKEDADYNDDEENYKLTKKTISVAKIMLSFTSENNLTTKVKKETESPNCTQGISQQNQTNSTTVNQPNTQKPTNNQQQNSTIIQNPAHLQNSTIIQNPSVETSTQNTTNPVQTNTSIKTESNSSL